jgi:hypothetical protein
MRRTAPVIPIDRLHFSLHEDPDDHQVPLQPGFNRTRGHHQINDVATNHVNFSD